MFIPLNIILVVCKWFYKNINLLFILLFNKYEIMRNSDRKKWMIINIEKTRTFGLIYEWFIIFRIWDDKYKYSDINKLIKLFWILNIDSLEWTDFLINRVLVEDDDFIKLEVYMLNNYLNFKKQCITLSWEKIQ